MYMGSYALSWFGDPPQENPWVINETNLEDGDEIRMQGFIDLASGGSPLYAVANRLYYGIGGGSAEPAKEVFEVMKRVEEIHKDSVPVAYVSIVRRGSRSSGGGADVQLEHDDEQESDAGNAGRWISVDVNPSTEMSAEWLKGQRVIALCGASGISDEDARKLGDG